MSAANYRCVTCARRLPGGLDPAWLQQPLGQLILATLLQFWCGRSIFIDAIFTAWYRRRMNLNTLVAVCTGAAYFYSLAKTSRSAGKQDCAAVIRDGDRHWFALADLDN